MTETRDQRVYAIVYSNDSREELAERIVALEDERDHWRVEQAHAYGNWEDAYQRASELEDENAKLREQMDWLLTLLRNDCDIDASWDGLRRFWSIGLTEDGCLMRDRACKAEAENCKLRELVDELWVSCPVHDGDCDECKHKGGRTGCELYDRMRELGIEVDG